MERKCTERRSRGLDQRPITGAPSKGSELERNFCVWLKDQGFFVVARNQKIAGVEVDVLARDQRGLLFLFEVKSQSEFRGEQLISFSQLKRLHRVVKSLSEVEPVVVELVYPQEITWIRVPLA